MATGGTTNKDGGTQDDPEREQSRPAEQHKAGLEPSRQPVCPSAWPPLSPPLTCLVCHVTPHLLSVGQVQRAEEGVIFWGRLAILILVQEERRATQLHAQLLDALLAVDGQEESLDPSLGLDSGEDGEVLGEHTAWGAVRQNQVNNWDRGGDRVLYYSHHFLYLY